MKSKSLLTTDLGITACAGFEFIPVEKALSQQVACDPYGRCFQRQVFCDSYRRCFQRWIPYSPPANTGSSEGSICEMAASANQAALLAVAAQGIDCRRYGYPDVRREGQILQQRLNNSINNLRQPQL